MSRQDIADAFKFKHGWPPESEPLLAPKHLKISVVMTARNEGVWVIPTIENLMACGADEIIVVDDAGTDGSCDPSKMPGDVIVERHAEMQGVAASRNTGMALATGHIISTADGHVTGPEGSLRKMGWLAYKHRAIVAPATQRMEWPEWGTAYCADMFWAWPSGRLRYHFIKDKPKKACTEIACLFGSVYVHSREAYEQMGGWIRTRQYGYNEFTHSLAAIGAGVDLYCDNETVFQHHFKQATDTPHKVMAKHQAWNLGMAAAVVFEPETFEKYWRPALEQTIWKRYGVHTPEFMADPIVRSERARYAKVKKLTDPEIGDRVGIDLRSLERFHVKEVVIPEVTDDVARRRFPALYYETRDWRDAQKVSVVIHFDDDDPERAMAQFTNAGADEIILVDDAGSADCDCARDLPASVNVIRHRERKGLSASWDDGWRVATYGTILFADTSVIPHVEGIARLSVLANRYEAVVCPTTSKDWIQGHERFGASLNMDDQGNFTSIPWLERDRAGDTRVTAFAAPVFCATKTTMKRLGGFNRWCKAGHLEDFAIRCGMAAVPIVCDAKFCFVCQPGKPTPMGLPSMYFGEEMMAGFFLMEGDGLVMLPGYGAALRAFQSRHKVLTDAEFLIRCVRADRMKWDGKRPRQRVGGVK